MWDETKTEEIDEPRDTNTALLQLLWDPKKVAEKKTETDPQNPRNSDADTSTPFKRRDSIERDDGKSSNRSCLGLNVFVGKTPRWESRRAFT